MTEVECRCAPEVVFAEGNLYDMGYYPMLLEEGSGTVRGKLISVANVFYAEILNRLDNLEGYDPDQPGRSSFTRKRRAVMTESGQKNRPGSTSVVKN